MVELKDTLLMPNTKFPMRGNLPNKEPQFLQRWEEMDLYNKILEKNAGKPSYVLHDGPPYANGNIHIGHALNKILKDFIVKYKNMNGFVSPYVPGWDTHGLPIEQVLVNNGVDRKSMPATKFRNKCKDYALKQVDKQRADFKKLGVIGDWENPYLTLDPKFEAEQIRVFGKMVDKGYIYKGLKPIYWSPSSESALAEAEIEYHDHTSPSIYVAFDLVSENGAVEKGTKFVIWTTTPWTLPANLGIAVHPDFEYQVVKYNGESYLVAKERVAFLAEKFGWENYETGEVLVGKDLEYLLCQHPFLDRTSTLILADYVTLDSGTGLVHTAPGHGEDDFYYSRKYNLDVLSPVDNQGHYTAEAPGFEGMFYAKANKVITDLLAENGSLLKLSYFVHSYPHDWRTKKPVIFRATPQWFASIDAFRQDILDVIENDVKWYHPSGQVRIYNMVRDRGDWVISRQRVWGVPLPVFYGENGEPIITPETIEHVAKLVEEFGSDVWFEREAKDLLPEGFTHPSSPTGTFTKEMDIMDVWFDSGSSHAGVLSIRPELTFPADLYLEGSDQYRGWFNSSLTTSVAVHKKAPYKAVLSQGFVMDGEGKKMSKSLGNVISPAKEMQTKGADIIRLWVSSVDYESDVRISTEILNQVSEAYRKIRNTMRFMLANTTDFEPSKHAVAFKDLRSVDQYMMIRFNDVVKTIEEAYEKYEFSTIYQTVMNFCTVDLSQFYLDFAKDVVYIEHEDNYERRAMQTVIYDILVKLTKLLSPILVHTSEEVWKYLKEEEAYVQLAEFPVVENYENTEEVLAQWAEFFKVRNTALKALEEARNEKLIGKNFEAKVTLYPSNEVRALLDSLNTNVAQLFIVSELEVAQEGVEAPANAVEGEGVKVVVEHAKGETCERCRAVKIEVGTLEDAPTLCNRCAAIVREHFPEALVPEAE